MNPNDEQTDLAFEDDSRVRAFFAYPFNPPALAETITEAASKINNTHVAIVHPWERMTVTGKNIIQEICREIDRAKIFCAHLTGMNPNVMFELGYAIARNKRIWPVADTSITESKKLFEQFKILSTTGVASYTNSDQIFEAFQRERPYLDVEKTIFAESIEPTLSKQGGGVLFYVKSQLDTNASVRISKVLKDAQIPLIVDDPQETGIQPLPWYGQTIYSADAVIVHLLGPAREGSQVTNIKNAFVAGLAHGFGKPLLMLAESDYVTPLDYRELLFNYRTANEAQRHLEQWVAPVEKSYTAKVLKREQRTGVIRIKVELRDFYVQIGEYLAENEPNSLDNYYVETTAFREALVGTRRVFVGRKGTGKTANFLFLSSTLRRDKNVIVCILQPDGYEIEGLVKLFSRYREHDTKGHVIESLWKFLLLTEIAIATAAEIQGRPLWIERSDDEERVLRLLEETSAFRGDFSVRLEQCVKALFDVKAAESVSEQRSGVSEALHETALKTLRSALDDVLCKKDRVAILIDNLDKAWGHEGDLGQLSEFFLGLFSASNQLLNDFSRADSRRKAVNVTAAIFLRSDIFNRIIEVAREPDKIAVTRLMWDDPELLRQVIESRYLAAHPEAVNGAEIWEKYFCTTVKGMPTREYITSRTLPRPRDVVYFVKSAISRAVNRGHGLIEEGDVELAEYEYSVFAIQSIKVENGITLPQLEAVLYEFAGCPVVLPRNRIFKFITAAGIPESLHANVLNHLVKLSFLGMEVGPEEFAFSEEPGEYKKNVILARKMQQSEDDRRYQIHPAFRAYLEIRDA
jgi:hypothetical protein